MNSPIIINTQCRLIIAQCRSKVLQNAPREHSEILSTFIKLPFVFKTFVLSICEWSLKIVFIVFLKNPFFQIIQASVIYFIHSLLSSIAKHSACRVSVI